jgi:hypothetical protein
MNRGSVHPLSIIYWYSEDKLASAMKSYANAKYSTSEQVQEFANYADQLVFIMEILEKKDLETIQKEAIRKILAIATANQSHVRESQKLMLMSLNDMVDTVKRNLSSKVKTSLRSFLMRFANALFLPTGQASPNKMRLGGAQALLAIEQRDHKTSAQDRKRKSPEKGTDMILRQDKNCQEGQRHPL